MHDHGIAQFAGPSAKRATASRDGSCNGDLRRCACTSTFVSTARISEDAVRRVAQLRCRGVRELGTEATSPEARVAELEGLGVADFLEQLDQRLLDQRLGGGVAFARKPLH